MSTRCVCAIFCLFLFYFSAHVLDLDQVEFIVMGGTFMSMPEDYRSKFIAQLHNALSGFTGTDVDEAVRYSEQSKAKAIGITIETRPDYCLRPHLRYTSFFPIFCLYRD